MRKLYVYYFPDEQLSLNGDYGAFSGSGGRNWDLGNYNKFSGTYSELKVIITSLFENFDDKSTYMSVANLIKILGECPWKNGYITIENA